MVSAACSGGDDAGVPSGPGTSSLSAPSAGTNALEPVPLDTAYAAVDGDVSWAVGRDDRVELVVAAPAEIAPGERIPIALWIRNLGTAELLLDPPTCGAPFIGELRPGWAYVGEDDSHAVWDGRRDAFGDYYWGSNGEPVPTAPVAPILPAGSLTEDCEPAVSGIPPGQAVRVDAVTDLRLGPGRLPDAGWFQVDVRVDGVRAIADVELRQDVWRDDDQWALDLSLDEPSITDFVAGSPSSVARAALVFWQGWWQLEITPVDASGTPTGGDVLVVRPEEGSNERTVSRQPLDPIDRSTDAPTLGVDLAQLPPAPPPIDRDPLRSGRWFLREVDGEPWRYADLPTVSFDMEGFGAGAVRGYDGCNWFTATDSTFDGAELDRGELVESSARACEPTIQAAVSLPSRAEVSVVDGALVLGRIGDDGPARLRYGDLEDLPFASPDQLTGTWASPLDGSVLLELRPDGTARSGECDLWWESDRGRLVVGGWPRPDEFRPCGGGPSLLVDGSSGYRPAPVAARLDGDALVLEEGPTVWDDGGGRTEVRWDLGDPVRLVPSR